MRSPLICAALVSMIAFATPCGGQQPAPYCLDVKLHPQDADNWCWAASGQMIMEYFGTNVLQCDQATNVFKPHVCCNRPVPADCDKPERPQFAGNYGFACQPVNGALKWKVLSREILQNRRPVAFSWLWHKGGGHIMVAYGCLTEEKIDYVFVRDPGPTRKGRSRYFPYPTYVRGVNYSHGEDFYLVKRNQGQQPDAQSETGESDVVEDQDRVEPRTTLVDFKVAFRSSSEVAQKALQTYRKISARANDANAAKGELRLMPPFPVVFVGLSDLQKVNLAEINEEVVSRLLPEKVNQIIYPISQEGTVTDAITMAFQNDQWVVESFGDKELTTDLVELRAEYSEKLRRESASFYVITVPALNTFLVCSNTANERILISVTDHDSVGSKAKERMTAPEAIAKLASLAKSQPQAAP